MLEILETPLNLSLPLGQHPHCLLAQIPDNLVRGDQGYVAPRPDEQWARVRSVLELVTEGNGSFRKLHFLVFRQGAEAVALDSAVMHKDIRTGLPSNEAKTFGIVKPFYFASFLHC